MPMLCDSVIYSVTRMEHMVHNDFFLRYLDFPGEPMPAALTLTCLAGGRACYEIRYGAEEIAARFRYGREETARYRQSSLPRILGRARNLENPFLHEYFSFFSSQAVSALRVRAERGDRILEREIPVVPYVSPNRYRFPLAGTIVVTDTYPSLNSHRWCRNSEFAFDAGAFDETLARPLIGGAPVFAACGGVVEAVFDGLEDTGEDTDLEEIEARYGESARIDGNHVLLRHGGDELSLYAHLRKGSVSVRAGERVSAGQRIGQVGSSGSSLTPHLHFHVMREGIHGPGVPVRFENLTTILGQPCLLEDAVNLARSGAPGDPA